MLYRHGLGPLRLRGDGLCAPSRNLLCRNKDLRRLDSGPFGAISQRHVVVPLFNVIFLLIHYLSHINGNRLIGRGQHLLLFDLIRLMLGNILSSDAVLRLLHRLINLIERERFVLNQLKISLGNLHIISGDDLFKILFARKHKRLFFGNSRQRSLLNKLIRNGSHNRSLRGIDGLIFNKLVWNGRNNRRL